MLAVEEFELVPVALCGIATFHVLVFAPLPIGHADVWPQSQSVASKLSTFSSSR